MSKDSVAESVEEPSIMHNASVSWEPGQRLYQPAGQTVEDQHSIVTPYGNQPSLNLALSFNSIENRNYQVLAS